MGILYTFCVNSGNFAILSGEEEAIFIDSKLPREKEIIKEIVRGKNISGLILSSFEEDHSEVDGVDFILSNYRPNWIMYPKFWKDEERFKKVFKAVIGVESSKKKVFKRVPVAAEKMVKGLKYASLERLSNNFSFVPFSPFLNDKGFTENHCLVLKIVEKTTQKSVLVTGDAEETRWKEMCAIYGKKLKSNILQAPRHGFKDGITEEAFELIDPQVVLISSFKEDAPYEAAKIYQKTFWFSTDSGRSFATLFTSDEIKTYRI